jgi:hypothetical protein
MSDGPADEAAQKVTRAADTLDGGVTNPRVEPEISASLTSRDNNNMMNDPAQRKEFAQNLVDSGLLPALAFHQHSSVTARAICRSRN